MGKTPSSKKGVQGMALNCIWWWGSISGDLVSVDYSFIAITSKFTLGVVILVRVTSMGQIGLFKNYSYFIGPCAKKKKLLRNYSAENECNSLTSKHKITLNRLTLFPFFSRSLWFNGYRKKWTCQSEFKSWTRLFAFHIALISLEKVWIQWFSLHLWINSRVDWAL